MRLLCVVVFSWYSIVVFAQKLENSSYETLKDSLDACIESREYPKMMQYAELALQKVDTSEDNPNYARALYYLGFANFVNQNRNAAKDYLQQAAKLQEKAGPSKALGDSWHALGVFYLSVEETKEAKPYYLKAIAMRKQTEGLISTAYSTSLNNLAVLNLYEENYVEAERLLLQVKGILEDLNNTKEYSYISCLNNLGLVYQEIGEHEKAEKIYKNILDLADGLKTNVISVRLNSLNNLAVIYAEIELYDQALPMMLRVLKETKAAYGEKHPDYITTVHNLGQLYDDIREFDVALRFLEEALSLKKEFYGEDHLIYAKTLNSLANLFDDLGEYDKAEGYYQKVIEIRDQHYGRKSHAYADVIENLSIVYNHQGKSEEALVLMQKVIKTREVVGGREAFLAKSYNNLGVVYRALENYDLAIENFEKSMAITIDVLGEQYLNFSGSKNNLVSVYKRKGDFEKSEAILKSIIQQKTKADLIFDDDFEWTEKIDLAQISQLQNFLRSLSHWNEILETKKESLQRKKIVKLASRLLKEDLKNFKGDEEKLYILSRAFDWAERHVSLLKLPEEQEEAFEIAEQLKSVLLQENIRSNKHNVGGLADSLYLKEKSLQSRKKELDAALLKGSTENEKDSIKALLNNVNIATEEYTLFLEDKYPKYLDLKYKMKLPSIDQIKSQLKAKEAVVEFLVTDSFLYAFYITEEGLELKIQNIQHDQLKQKVKKLHDLLSNYREIKEENALENYAEIALDLYNLTLSKLLESKDIERIHLIPDAELAFIPFEALIVSDWAGAKTFKDLDYLLKHCKISYHYTAALWLEQYQHKKTRTNLKILGMSASYNENSNENRGQPLSSNLRQIRDNLQDLPEARMEVSNLKEKYHGDFIIGESATESAFLERAENYGVIHLAMHGILNERHPILSSLAFTDSNNSLDDNFLQAFEISKMELNAELVVLSACETGFGRFERGNAVASLARTFIYAGASSLVVSLWQVNDASTSMIMQNFYANLSRGQDKASALQAAKLSYLEHVDELASHPAFWAPFIQLGDSSPIKIAQKGGLNWTYLLWGAGLLVLVGGGIWAWRAKRAIA